MEPKGFPSGSMSAWNHINGMMPQGFELNKDDLYVLKGDVLSKIYRLILAQRFSSLQIISQIPPTHVADFTEYLAIVKHINQILNDIIFAMPLVNILQAQEEHQRTENSKQPVEDTRSSTLKRILEKFRLSMGSDRDESHPPQSNPPTE